MIEAFDKDPSICPHCHRELDLVEIWHAPAHIYLHNVSYVSYVSLNINNF